MSVRQNLDRERRQRVVLRADIERLADRPGGLERRWDDTRTRSNETFPEMEQWRNPGFNMVNADLSAVDAERERLRHTYRQERRRLDGELAKQRMRAWPHILGGGTSRCTA